METQSTIPPEEFKILLEKFDQLIAVTLDNKITPKVSLDKTLWFTQDIATYLGNSYKYTNEYIVTHHTFPEALRMPTKNQTKGYPRWYAGEVIRWVASHQEG